MPINRERLKVIIREELIQEKQTNRLAEKLGLLLERVESLSPREVRSVLNGLGMTKTVVLQKFKDYLESQKSTPLGAAADKRVAEKVKRLAQVFSKIWDDFYSTGTASFEGEETTTTTTGRTPGGETGTTGSEISEQDEIQIKAMADEAVRLLTLRLLTFGPKIYNDSSTLQKHGNYIKKKFFYTRSLREATDTRAPEPVKVTGSSSEKEIAKAFMAMSKKNRITPEQAQESLDSLTVEINVDAILDALKWRTPEPPTSEAKKLLTRLEHFIWVHAMKGDF